MSRLFQRTIMLSICLLAAASSSTKTVWAANQGPPISTKKPQGQNDGRKLPAGAVACMRSDEAGPVFAVAFAPDGTTLASAGYDRTIRLWSPKTGKQIWRTPVQKGKVRSIAYSPDGKLIASASSEKSVCVWDAGSGREIRKLSGDLETVVSLAFSPNGKMLAGGGGLGEPAICLWDFDNKRTLRTLELRSTMNQQAWSVIRALSFTADGKRLAAASESDMVGVFDVTTGKEQLHYLAHEKGALSIAFAPDDRALLTAGGDGIIRLWDATSGKKLREFKGHEDWVTTAIFSPNGRTIASTSCDKTVRIWEVATGKEIRQFIGHADQVRCAAFALDGKTLATGGVDSAVFVWDVAKVCAVADVRIRVGPNVHVSKSRENSAHGEVIIAADPKDPARLLAASVISVPTKDRDNVPSVVAYRSFDAGKTWELALAKGEDFGDPALAFDPEGCAYFVALHRGFRPESCRSRDGGKTWQAPIKMADQVDRPFLTVDHTTGKFRGRLYCNGNLIGKDGFRPTVYVSRDSGKTFAPPKPLSVKDGTSDVPGTCVVLSDGTLVVPYKVLDLPTNGRYSIRVRRSINGGESFLDEQYLLGRDFLDGAHHFDAPVLAVDPGSKAFKDYLYLVWSENTSVGSRAMFVVSKDKGVNWSTPVHISEQVDDKDEAKARRFHSVLPCVAVNAAGVVGVSWYDSRDSQEKKRCCNLRFRAALDGGKTWLPSATVTDVASSFDLMSKTDGHKGIWLGETAGLAADAAGHFHPLWVDNRTGVPQVFTAKVTVDEN
jgi:WD40 repeat protein